MRIRHRLASRSVLLAVLMLGACASSSPPPAPEAAFTDIGYADWSDSEPPYRFYPGDELDVNVPSAPELNKTVTVQPDGRISIALAGAVMAADRTQAEVEAALNAALTPHLLRPQAYVTPKAAPLKVFVGGEVGNPGVYDLVGDADALRAVVQAGGFQPTADRSKVYIIRRGPDGHGMVRTADLLKGISTSGADLVPLRRYDVVYVPRSGVAAANLAVQQYIRDLSPIQLGFSWNVNGASN
jgi:protein involved in polysaccharide export with SLBB domain